MRIVVKRPDAPAPAKAAVRVRTRPAQPETSAAPALRVRVRAPVEVAKLHLGSEAFPYARTDTALALTSPAMLLPKLGEIRPTNDYGKWHGWPNGSCVNRVGTKGIIFHLGRMIQGVGGKGYHVLRWSAPKREYFYVGFKSDHLAALASLA